jgi:hypothetical protein
MEIGPNGTSLSTANPKMQEIFLPGRLWEWRTQCHGHSSMRT